MATFCQNFLRTWSAWCCLVCSQAARPLNGSGGSGTVNVVSCINIGDQETQETHQSQYHRKSRWSMSSDQYTCPGLTWPANPSIPEGLTSFIAYADLIARQRKQLLFSRRTEAWIWFGPLHAMLLKASKKTPLNPILKDTLYISVHVLLYTAYYKHTHALSSIHEFI